VVPDSDVFRIYRRDGGWCAECLVCQITVSIANKTKREVEPDLAAHLQHDHGRSSNAMITRRPDARFIVRTAFTLTGRGTCVCGYPEYGAPHTGDALLWSDRTSDRQSTCRGIELIREVPMKNPPTIGLVVTDAFPEDFHEGMAILAFRTSA
jgi:hypothetical protein